MIDITGFVITGLVLETPSAGSEKSSVALFASACGSHRQPGVEDAPQQTLPDADTWLACARAIMRRRNGLVPDDR